MVELRDAGRIVGAVFRERGGQRLRTLHQERAVHQDQRPRHEHAASPLRVAERGIGKVEAAIERWQQLPVDVAVERAPRVGATPHGLPRWRGIEPAADSQQRIAERFEFQRPHREVGPLVAGREHQILMHLLEAPAVVHEPGGEVVEQRLVGRLLPLKPEVARAADERRAEVPGPDAVDDHPGREWILPAGECLRELQPATCVLRERLRRNLLEHGDELPRGLRALEGRIAADVDMAFDRLRRIGKHHWPWRRTWMILDELHDLVDRLRRRIVRGDDPRPADLVAGKAEWRILGDKQLPQ